jgi:hypothetical protein
MQKTVNCKNDTGSYSFTITTYTEKEDFEKAHKKHTSSKIAKSCLGWVFRVTDGKRLLEQHQWCYGHIKKG